MDSVRITARRDETEPVGARERILAAAYTLFSQHGVAAVGIDSIIARSGTAKMSLYRHFGSKDELVLAFLRQREQEWTRSWLEATVMARATEPTARCDVELSSSPGTVAMGRASVAAGPRCPRRRDPWRSR